ncbi:hypothetical protein SSYIS1_14120 [Serratia symbiotica]|uniref:Uncharacterized protein n=1 Tax=Serratia symbiotica TaxID=138074 RepID=A0A455VS97_9GAMM|nr:hypothetical protein SSYIS1_14120 [Serratia symbiotica]
MPALMPRIVHVTDLRVEQSWRRIKSISGSAEVFNSIR